MNPTVGSIQYDASIKLDQLKRDSREAERIAKGTGEGIGDGIENGSGRASVALSKMAKFAKVAALAVGVAFTAAVGKFVIAGGISRALNIEDAQAKLRGLGHDAQSVSKIMESALSAVKGTAYGLDSAATIAASAVAAGVKPGQELAKYLGLTADAATIAGVSLDEMGSIFNKVTTGQKAYTRELRQLSDRGIPIYQWLQEELGLSAEALDKMVSDGKLDSETYFKVIQKNIGGAAHESGKTTRGAWANMQAAMARVGAAIVEDIIPKVRESFKSMTEWFDDNSDTIVGAVGRAVNIMKDFAGNVIQVGREVGSYLAPAIIKLFSALIYQLIPALSRVFNQLQPFISVVGIAAVGALNLLIHGVSMVVTVVSGLINILTHNRAVFATLAGAVAGATAAFILYNTTLKIVAATKAMLMAATIAYSAVMAIHAQGVGVARSAWILLNITMIASPLGLMVLGIGLLIGIVYGLETATSGQTTAQQRANNEMQRAVDLAKKIKDLEKQVSEQRLALKGNTLGVERAQVTYNQAVERYGANSLEAREAAYNLELAQERLNEKQKELDKSTKDLTTTQEDNQKAIQGVIDKLDSLNGKSVKYTINGEQRFIQKLSDGEVVDTPGFSKGGFTGRGHKNEPAGIVHKGEYVIPKELVNQSRGIPDIPTRNTVDSGIENNIGTINIANEADGEKWLRKLTRNQEITSTGLTPAQGLM